MKAPVPGVPPPIAPGAAKVAPLSVEALRFATLVVEEMTNGAVPVPRVEVNCPDILIVVIPDSAPAFITREFIVLVVVGAVSVPVKVVPPVIANLLFMVVVPVVLPRFIVVPAPPIFMVVAVSLKRYPVVAPVVRYPLLAAKLPDDVIFPLQVRFPLALVMVHPVFEEPPARLTSPVDADAILTAPVVPASRDIDVAAVEG